MGVQDLRLGREEVGNLAYVSLRTHFEREGICRPKMVTWITQSWTRANPWVKLEDMQSRRGSGRKCRNSVESTDSRTLIDEGALGMLCPEWCG